MKRLFNALISATAPESSKRFVVICSIGIFLSLAVVLIVLQVLLFLRALSIPSTTVGLFYGLFGQVVSDMFYIICFGIGAITITNTASYLGAILSKKGTAAIIAASNHTPDTQVVNQQVDNQNIGKATVAESTGTPAPETPSSSSNNSE